MAPSSNWTANGGDLRVELQSHGQSPCNRRFRPGQSISRTLQPAPLATVRWRTLRRDLSADHQADHGAIVPASMAAAFVPPRLVATTIAQNATTKNVAAPMATALTVHVVRATPDTTPLGSRMLTILGVALCDVFTVVQKERRQLTVRESKTDLEQEMALLSQNGYVKVAHVTRQRHCHCHCQCHMLRVDVNITCQRQSQGECLRKLQRQSSQSQSQSQSQWR